jgi:predicted RNA-binding protein YlxR (DUF448 family)
VVRTPDGRVELDPTGKRNGRGAYVCTSPACWEAALQRGILIRALKIQTLVEDDLQTLNAHAQRLSGTPETVASSPPLE